GEGVEGGGGGGGDVARAAEADGGDGAVRRVAHEPQAGRGMEHGQVALRVAVELDDLVLVVPDRADRGAAADGGSRRGAQRQGERLRPLVERVAHYGHHHRLRRLPLAEADGTARGRVLRPGGGGARRRGIVRRDRLAAGRRERDREHHVRRPGVPLLDRGVPDREGGERIVVVDRAHARAVRDRRAHRVAEVQREGLV